jgi:hypothetical protein
VNTAPVSRQINHDPGRKGQMPVIIVGQADPDRFAGNTDFL